MAEVSIADVDAVVLIKSEHAIFAYYVTGHGFGHATRVIEVLLDYGAVKTDALTVDRLASLEKYLGTAVVPRASILETEVEWLKSIKADLVISDVVPVACRAAADAGIRFVCVTNFRFHTPPKPSITPSERGKQNLGRFLWVQLWKAFMGALKK